ncbi:MAG: hypothetical protein JKX70_05615, partial [Phycisphaerales bacterium]|nr:hypothetical protein [Phycisphaerales bacterium]
GTTPSLAMAGDPDSFWTEFVPSTDTRLIFVSESEGNDANSGLNPGSPVKTLHKGYQLLRDGYPDWMLLKRGDAWNESVPNWDKSGRSESETMVMGAYGDDSARPQIRPDGGAVAMRFLGGDEIGFVAFVGLHLEPLSRTDDQRGTGIRMLKSSHNILFEDMYVRGFAVNFVLQEYSGSTITDIKLNGCVVVDAWALAGHSQGLFAKGVDGLILENCVFDSNGFNLSRGAQPTIFNRNAYIQYTCENVSVNNTIFANGASTGIQMRAGGVLNDNLFIRNPTAFGIGAGGAFAREGGVTAEVRRNLIMYGKGISDSLPRAFGAAITNTRSLVLSDNIFYSSVIDYNGSPIKMGDSGSYGLTDILIENNTIVDWHGSVRIIAPGDNQLYDNIRIQNNHIYADLTANNGNGNFNKSMMSVFDSNHPAITISDNDYHYIGMHNLPFKIGSTNTSVESWSSQIEPNGVYTQIDTIPVVLGLDAYLTSIGRQGGIDEFMVMARTMSRQDTDPDIRPYAVYTWHRDQLLELLE